MAIQTTNSMDEQAYMEQLRSVQPTERMAGLDSLAKSKFATAVPDILALLKTESVDSVRQKAVKTLGEIAAPEAVTDLIRILKSSESREVRASAAYSLGKIAQPEAIPALTACIQNEAEDFEVVIKSFLALSEYKTTQAWEALRQTLAKNSRANVRQRLIDVLGKARYLPAVPEIEQALGPGEDFQTRRAAVKALVTLQGSVCIPSITRILTEPNQTDLQLLVIEQLDEMEDPGALKPMCKAMIEIADEDVRAAIKTALKKTSDWRQKANQFMNLFEEEAYTQAGLPADEIVAAIAPDAQELSQNRYVLTDLLIERSKDFSDPRLLEILGAMIRASTFGDQDAAGERLNDFEKRGRLSRDKLDQLRIRVGGEKALSPMLSLLNQDLETYFRLPVKNLNDITMKNWQDTIRYAQSGFLARMVMSGVVFLVGILLVCVSGFRFMFSTLDTQQMFGNGVSFVSGLATMLLIIYTGPLKQIRGAVDDLGTANAAFIAYIHRVLQTSHTFSLYYLHERINFEEMQKSSLLIQQAMSQTIHGLRLRPKDIVLDDELLREKLKELATTTVGGGS